MYFGYFGHIGTAFGKIVLGPPTTLIFYQSYTESRHVPQTSVFWYYKLRKVSDVFSQ